MMQELQWPIGTTQYGFHRISRDKFLGRVRWNDLSREDAEVPIYLSKDLPKDLRKLAEAKEVYHAD